MRPPRRTPVGDVAWCRRPTALRTNVSTCVATRCPASSPGRKSQSKRAACPACRGTRSPVPTTCGQRARRAVCVRGLLVAARAAVPRLAPALAEDADHRPHPAAATAGPPPTHPRAATHRGGLAVVPAKPKVPVLAHGVVPCGAPLEGTSVAMHLRGE